MADNYLEKKFEDLSKRKGVKRKILALSLNSLLLKNRSHRAYDRSYEVSQREIDEIIDVNRYIPSTRNQQVLRFKSILGDDALKYRANIKLGGALPELNLPPKGEEPTAYIVVCSTVPENKWIDIDLGISIQSMLLKAVDIGLNGVCIGSFNREETQKIVGDQFYPLIVLAIGKGLDKIQILPIEESESHNYFRENGIHYVPKVKDLKI